MKAQTNIDFDSKSFASKSGRGSVQLRVKAGKLERGV